ncbi:oxidoreductase [Lithospermum erythrorhizon]|uniref:Oxidoreductase n=1 Tax=Lithospermum erythrorhizon TaxID=34254 RepID=A0AAV3P2E1_LITER
MVNSARLTLQLQSSCQYSFFSKKQSIPCTIFTHISTKCSTTLAMSQKKSEELLVVVGGGAAGIYGAIWAKTVAPNLNVVVIEKGKPLTKVKISGGGRCNVTNGHYVDNLILAENYPRGHKELRGSFFKMHSPTDTVLWFSNHGVILKTEDDGRVFPVSDSSSSIIDCLMSEAKKRGVVLQTGNVVMSASATTGRNFSIKIRKRMSEHVENVEANYLLVASGSSQEGYGLATQLDHSIIKPVPSLFTFKIDDMKLKELTGVTLNRVKAKLKLETVKKNIPQLTQIGPMLVTHWGLSGPVILRLSAWGARDFSDTGYKGTLLVDFVPDIGADDLHALLIRHKNQFQKQKLLNSYPSELGLVKRFWKYILDRQGFDEDILWASVSKNFLFSVATLLKSCSFEVKGKGQFKDEFVTAGGVPLSEIFINTMESRIHSNLFFAGEILNVDGVTGGFNFQNAWSGGYIAGISIGKLAAAAKVEEGSDLVCS